MGVAGMGVGVGIGIVVATGVVAAEGAEAAVAPPHAASPNDAMVDSKNRRERMSTGQCAGAGCGWFFLDTTKRGNRRWCSMRDCGQDAKSARRRARGARTLAG